MGGSSTAAGGSVLPFVGGVQEAQGAFGPTLPFPNTGQAANNAYSGIGGLNTNPAAQYGNAANVGQNLTSYGSAVASQAPGWLQQGQNDAAAYSPYIGQALTQGFDPQNALYAKQFQQQQDQTNAQNAMSGVAATPYGAALSNQANTNFNLDWQNQQLQREATAAGTASTLGGAQNAALSTGVNNASSLLGAGANAATSGLGMGQNIDTQQYNAQQQQLQDFLSYIGASGANASQYLSALQGLLGGAVNQASVTNTGAQQSNASNNSALGGLGSLAGSLVKFL